MISPEVVAKNSRETLDLVEMALSQDPTPSRRRMLMKVKRDAEKRLAAMEKLMEEGFR